MCLFKVLDFYYVYSNFLFAGLLVIYKYVRVTLYGGMETNAKLATFIISDWILATFLVPTGSVLPVIAVKFKVR